MSGLPGRVSHAQKVRLLSEGSGCTMLWASHVEPFFHHQRVLLKGRKAAVGGTFEEELCPSLPGALGIVGALARKTPCAGRAQTCSGVQADLHGCPIAGGTHLQPDRRARGPAGAQGPLPGDSSLPTATAQHAAGCEDLCVRDLGLRSR